MKTYRGVRHARGCSITVTHEDGGSFGLPARYDLRNHSPDGFEWGYGGSGPTQASLALLAHALGDDARALRLYQDFKFAYVAGLSDVWEITDEAIKKLADEIEAKKCDA